MPPKFAKPTRKPRRKPARPTRRRVARKPRVARRALRVPRGVGTAMIQGQLGSATQSTVSHVTRHKNIRRSGITTQGAPHYWLNNLASIMQPALGYQGVFMLGQWNSIADTYAVQQLIPTQPTNTSVAPSRFCMKSMTADVSLTNTSTLTAFVDLYDIVCTRDVPFSQNSALSVGTPQNAWRNGLVDQQTEPNPGSGSGHDVYLIPGTHPTDSQLFKDFYRIKQRKSIIMAPGAMHLHHVSSKTGRMFDVNQIQTYVPTMSALAGYTTFTMAVVRGQVVTAFADAVATATIGDPVIRVLTSERYEYSYIFENGSTFQFGTVLTDAGVVNQLLLNSPATGLPIAA